MVYAALIAALASTDPLHGAALMGAFGLGTLPNLLILSTSFRHISRVAKSRLARAVAAAVIAAVGIAGIARAVQPAVISVDGTWCLQIPGLAALLGGGA
jgi:sulfite exporter TauE/SafE